MTKVVFPSFSGQDFQPFEMRQLVSALELRFQALEDAAQVSTLPSTDVTGDEYAPLVHTHVEADITDLGAYLTDITGESVFDLSDVSGTPSINDVLIWNGAAFAPGPQSGGGGATILDDLNDVSLPILTDGYVLTYNATAMLWESGALKDIGVAGQDTTITGTNVTTTTAGSFTVTSGSVSINGVDPTTHLGEVTGAQSLTVDVTSITNRTDIGLECDPADDFAIHDDDVGTLKKVNASVITDGGYF